MPRRRSPWVLLPFLLAGAALWGCGSKGSPGGASGTSTTSSTSTGSSASTSSGTGGATAASSSSTGGHGGTGTGGTGTGGGEAGCGDGVCAVGESCHTCSADCGPCCAGGTCCGNGACDPGETCSTCPQDCKDAKGQPCQRVGILYEGWHLPAYTAVQATAAAGKPVLTVEDVIRSRVESGTPPGPVYTFDQILNANGLAGVAGSFYYQATPLAGPYCIVHRRSPGALNYEPTHEGTYGQGSVPDCPKYAGTLARHASQLVAAGVDHVAVDATNLSEYDAFSDAIQLRPFEVVLEEWGKLRKAGVKTPDVAIWQRLSAPGTMLSHVLALYGDPANDALLLRDAATGKKIFFYPDLPDVDAGLLASVAADGGKNDIVPVPMWVHRQAQGSWSFFSECQKGAQIDDAPCAQAATAKSVVGSQLAVSPSYQLSYGSLPFQAVGVYGGLTLRKQLETAFAVQPRWLFVSSFNEHVAQPQPNAPGVSMGFETDPTIGHQAFVDTYGVEFSRDLEPTREYGSLLYDLLASCLRVYRKGSSTCSDPAEACCQGGNYSSRYAYFNGPGGLFALYAAALGPGPGKSPLYHCLAGTSDDFFSPDPACEGTKVVGQVGLVSTTKGGATLRALRRCYGGGSHAYSLTGSCPAGTSLEAVLGYVR